MLALKPTGNHDCDDVLNWLDAHSVNVSQGLPALTLHSRWTQAGREAGALGSVLQRLLSDDWIMMTPGVEPPHLRFSVEGFRRLTLAAEDAANARLEAIAAEQDAAAAKAAEEDGEPAPILFAPISAPAEPATAVSALAPSRVRHDHDASELSLRNNILALFRDLNLKAESRLIGITLSRYWQEAGHRATHLRTGIDVLLRDGYLEQRLVGIDRHWLLTHDGAFFIKGPLTPQCLLKLAPPVDTVDNAPAPAELRRLLARILFANLGEAGVAIGYQELRPDWMMRTRLDDNALLHALDLLYKGHHITIGDTDDVSIALTPAGAQMGGQGEIARLFTKLSRALG